MGREPCSTGQTGRRRRATRSFLSLASESWLLLSVGEELDSPCRHARARDFLDRLMNRPLSLFGFLQWRWSYSAALITPTGARYSSCLILIRGLRSLITQRKVSPQDFPALDVVTRAVSCFRSTKIGLLRKRAQCVIAHDEVDRRPLPLTITGRLGQAGLVYLYFNYAW